MTLDELIAELMELRKVNHGRGGQLPVVVLNEDENPHYVRFAFFNVLGDDGYTDDEFWMDCITLSTDPEL